MTVESDNFFPVRRPEVAARSEPFANHDPRAVWRVLRGLVRARLGDEHVGPSGAVDTKHPTPPRRAHRHRCGPCWRAHPSPARGSCTPVCRAVHELRDRATSCCRCTGVASIWRCMAGRSRSNAPWLRQTWPALGWQRRIRESCSSRRRWACSAAGGRRCRGAPLLTRPPSRRGRRT